MFGFFPLSPKQSAAIADLVRANHKPLASKTKDEESMPGVVLVVLEVVFRKHSVQRME